MGYALGPEDSHLVDYTRVLRRRWWLIVVVAIIGTLGGIGYFKVAHKTYIATSSVYVTATSGTVNQVANGRTSGAVDLDTEAQVVQSAAVAQAAAKLLHSPESVVQLLQRVKVTVPANSQVLNISCQARSSVTAAACAQAFAQAYLSYSRASTTAATNAQISALQSKISALEAASAKLAVEVTSLPSNSSQRAADTQQLNSNQSQLNSLNSQVAQLTADQANPSGGSIISNAIPPASPSSPKALLILPSGLLVGLLAGLILAFIVDRRDLRIRGPHDMAQLDVPVLMSLPSKPAPELTIAVPRSPVGRDFSELAHVLVGLLGEGSHAVLVAGSSAGHGTSLVTANLAVALARNQPAVTLVCADLEGSAIPDMMGIPAAAGLTDLLAVGKTTANAGQQLVNAPRLRVVTPGSAAGPDAEDLQQDAVDRLLNGLRKESRWVIVEGPPVMSGPDVYTLAHAIDAAVLVAEIPGARRDQIMSSVQNLDKVNKAVLGVVLLPSPRASGNRGVPGPAETSPEPTVQSDAIVAGVGPVDGNGTRNAREDKVDWPSGADSDNDATVAFNWSPPKEAPSSVPRN